MGETARTRTGSGNGGPPLRRLVAGACVLTAALFVPLAWHIAHSFRTCQQITESYVAGETLRDAVYHANAELILDARAAVLGGEPRAERPRGAMTAELRRLLARARALRDGCGDRCWLTVADSLQGELRDVEAASIMLAETGRREEAVALLVSPGYAAIHDAFHAALDRYAEAFKARVTASIEYERREELRIVGVSGGILLASVAIWALLVRTLERWRAGLQREAREREAAERHLAAALRRFRRLFHHAHDAIYLVSAADGRVLDANRAACVQTRYSRRELKTLRFADLDEAPATASAWQQRVGGGGVAERRHRRRDGTVFPVEVAVRLIDERPGPVQLCIVRDVSERKEFEEHLGRAQKMECVGRLAAGIAHDFGNVLLAVSGFAMVGRRRLPAGHEAGEAFSRIETAAAQAVGLARSLLHFADRPATQPRAVDVRRTVAEALDLLDPSLPGAVELDASRVPGPPVRTRADPQRLQQAVLNLCLNARDAMPEGGRLSVAVTPAGGRDGVVRVSVADTGHGIPAAVRRRLGEPFFTTKSDDAGRGLGLFNVRTIMAECGGRLEVDSAPGAGSTFSLVLPRLAGAEAERDGGPRPAARAAGASVALALAGELARGLAAEALRGLGCTVHPVPDAPALAERLARDAVDVAVVDGDLPDDGAAACLAALDGAGAPASLVLIAGARECEFPATAVRLVKPYTMPELGEAVAAAAAGRCREERA